LKGKTKIAYISATCGGFQPAGISRRPPEKPKAIAMLYFKSAEEVLYQWVSRVCSGNPDDITALYHETAILIPTFSPHTVTSTEGVRNYFGQLATRSGLGVRLHGKTLRKQSQCETLHTLSGIYSFEFEVDQVLLSFPSRFSFVVDLSLEKPIIHHHSSQVPRNLS
jgi:hypothetical protein